VNVTYAKKLKVGGCVLIALACLYVLVSEKTRDNFFECLTVSCKYYENVYNRGGMLRSVPRTTVHKVFLPTVLFWAGAALIIVGLVRTEDGQTSSKKGSLSVTDELLQLKALLDSGAITEEEFDEQKQKLLSR